MTGERIEESDNLVSKATGERIAESDNSKTNRRKRPMDDDDFDAVISRHEKDIMSGLKLIEEGARKYVQVKTEETFTSVAPEIKSSWDELKLNLDKERQSFANTLSKSPKKCKNLLKSETTKFLEVHGKFSKEKDSHLQAMMKDFIKEEKEEQKKLIVLYEQLRKKEQNMLAEHEKTITTRIAQLEESRKKEIQDHETFRLTLEIILEWLKKRKFSVR